MRILVTAGAVFIGANLVRTCLAHDHEIVVLDDLSTGNLDNLEGTDVSFIRGSVTDATTVRRAASDVDSIVHLAARGSVPRSLKDPVATHEVNATGTLNVLEAARLSRGQQVIMASSSSVYGANPELPKREDGATRPMSPYAASKLAAEGYAIAYRTAYDLPTLAFRFFNVFGRFQSAGHAYAAVIPSFIDAALRGETLTVHGDGTQSRDFTHVDTVCATICQAIDSRTTSPDPINLAFGTRTTLLEVIETLSSKLDQPIVVENVENRVGDVPHSQADSSKLRDLFGDIDPVDFSSGLVDTIEWMRSQFAPRSSATPLSTGSRAA